LPTIGPGRTSDLEHADGVAGLDLGVDRRVVEADAGQVDGLGGGAGDQLDATLHRRQHAQAEQVDLEEAGVGAGVLVPLADATALHGGRQHRHQLDQRGGGDDHAAGVLADVAG
jgi:hypothetical protein